MIFLFVFVRYGKVVRRAAGWFVFFWGWILKENQGLRRKQFLCLLLFCCNRLSRILMSHPAQYAEPLVCDTIWFVVGS